MRMIHAAKAAPRSRKTSMVMCHSPSHFIAGSASLKGMEALRFCSSAPLPPNSRVSSFLSASFIWKMAYTGLSTTPATSADDVGHGHEVLVIDALLDGDVLDLHQLAQRHQRRAAGAGFGQRVGIAGAHAEGQQLLRRGFGRLNAAVRARMFTSSFSSG
jgi:hypothetical protein